MNYITIHKISGFDMPGYSIQADMDGVRLERMKCYGYGKRDALRLYREKYNLKYKKLVKVEY
jgi:hypothetical protein